MSARSDEKTDLSDQVDLRRNQGAMDEATSRLFLFTTRRRRKFVRVAEHSLTDWKMLRNLQVFGNTFTVRKHAKTGLHDAYDKCHGICFFCAALSSFHLQPQASAVLFLACFTWYNRSHAFFGIKSWEVCVILRDLLPYSKILILGFVAQRHRSAFTVIPLEVQRD